MSSELENAMLKHMKKIVYEESRPFSFLDFMEFEVDGKPYSARRGTIRNKFSKFAKEKKIEFCYNDGVAFYTLAGKQFGKNKLMTPNHTDTSTIINYNTDKRSLLKSIKQHPIYKLIQYIPFGKRSIHDLHLTFESKGLWRYLSNIEYFKQRTDSQSKSISSDISK